MVENKKTVQIKSILNNVDIKFYLNYLLELKYF